MWTHNPKERGIAVAHLKKCYQEHRVAIWIGTVVLAAQLIYLSNAAGIAPVMDYWNYIAALGDKIALGVSFGDLWNLNGVHHAPVQLFLWLCNVWLFHWQPLIAIYLGAFVTAVTLWCIGKAYCAHCKAHSSISQSVVWIGFFGICISLYNGNQWEITTLEFSLAFALRLLVIWLLFVRLDRLLRSDQKSEILFVEFGLLSGIAIVMLLSGYFPVVVGCIAIVMLFHHFGAKKLGLATLPWKCFFAVMVPILVFSALYLFTGNEMAGSETNIAALISVDTIKAVLLMLGSCVVHGNLSIEIHFALGMLFFFLYLAAVLLYFKFEMYRDTYLPILLMLYAGGSSLLIILGRIGYGITYLTSSRYVYETSLGLIGIIWIGVKSILHMMEKEKKQTCLRSSAAFFFFCIAPICCLLISDAAECQMAKY